MAGSVVCYYRNSFLHGTVKKVYKTLVDSRDPGIVHCWAALSSLTRSYHAEQQRLRDHRRVLRTYQSGDRA